MVYVSKGSKELKRTYPNAAGLTAKTTTQTGRITNLVPVESNVSRKEKQGLK